MKRTFTKRMNSVLALVLTIVALAAGQSAWATGTFTVTNTEGTSKFVITRTSNTSTTEIVYYRTVSLSAIAGQHFTDTSGSLTFDADHNTQEVEIEEKTPSSDVYKYQTDTYRKYRFEVLDPGGFRLAYTDRIISSGLAKFTKSTYLNKSITNLVYFDGTGNFKSGSGNKFMDVDFSMPSGYADGTDSYAGFALIDDSYNYGQKAATVSTNSLISGTGVSASYLKNTLGYKIYATVCFTMKEKNDGYYYVQILNGTSNSSYDGYDSNGVIDNGPTNSIYKACFELQEGSGTYSGTGKAFFPHRYDYATPTAESNANIGITEFFPLGVNNKNGKLWQQKFNSNSYRANNSGSLVLDPTVANITTRFDCAGEDNDTWGYKDFFVRMALVDATAPTASGAKKVNGGRRSKGNTIYVSVPFSEIVTVSGTPTLTTTWGTLYYIAGSGSNVLTFSGTISDSASGAFTISGYSGTIQDLAGNSLSGTISGQLLDSSYLEGSYSYPITYNDLADGTVEPANPSTYTYNTSTFMLNNPTRTGYDFDGWTGSNGTTPSTAVTIANHSHGDKSYTANWTAHTYTVRFHSNDGTNATADQSFTYDVAQNLTANAFTRPGYDFDHWTTNADGSGTTYTEGQEVLNLTATDGEVIDFYAQWTVHTYTVRFNANGGSGTMSDMDFTYDVAQNLTANAFTLLGYKFGGWTTIADGTGDSYTNAQNVINLTAVDGATVTLYAQWVLCDWTVDNEGTESDPYMIYRSEQFDQLATRVNSGTTYSGKFFKLGDNITVSTMVGTSEIKSFRGTFDGDNKTMTLALTATSNNCAPFMYMKDATIRNLNIAGTISTSNQFAASIAAHTTGTTNIQHCTSTVEITSTVGTANSDGTHGGFVAVNDAGTLNFSNCVFAGKLLGANATCNGGFVGWNEKTEVNYTDCLFAPAEVTMGEANSATFNRNGKNTFTRTYYLTPFGEAQGNQVVSDVTAFSANKVYKPITAVDGNNYIAECDITCVDEFYIYTGSVVNVTPVVKCDNTLTVGTDYTVTIKDSDNNTVAPEDLINKGDYTLIVDGIGSCAGTQTFAFSIVTSVNLNGYDFVLGKDAEGIYYKIETTDDLNRLAAYVNSGNEAYGQRFMQTADIAYTHTTAWNDATSTEDNYTAIGNYSHAFCGIFDGQGHTVSGIRIHKSSTQYQGLFGRIYGESCIVKNVTLTDARIKGNDYIGGITGQTYSYPTIQDCLVLNAAISGSYCGAVIGRRNNGTITTSNYYHNCTVNGNTSNVGYESGDINGARSVHTLTLGSGVTATATVAVTHDNTDYYTAGTTVTLSSSVPEGYVVVYSYNDGSYHIIDGNTFTMPAADATVSASLSVPYIDADGNEQTCTDFILLTSSTGSTVTLGTAGTESWYVVNGNVNITANNFVIEPFGAVHLILMDGATLTVQGSHPIDATGSLTIYGQSLGTGRLVANGSGTAIYVYKSNTAIVNDGILTINGGNITATSTNNTCIIANNAITINGGSVTASSSGMFGYGITSYGGITINGGTVNATGSDRAVGISAGNTYTLTLGWRNTTDRIYASSYQGPNGIVVKSGQAFTDGTNIYAGTLTSGQVSAIAGKTLQPVDALVLVDNADNTSIINDHNGETVNVMLYGRTLYKDGAWNTLCLPFDFWVGDIINNVDNPLHGATIMMFDRSSWYNANGEEHNEHHEGDADGCHRSGQIENGNLYLYFFMAMEGNSGFYTDISAGEPFLVKWDGDGSNNIVNPVFTNVTISNKTNRMNQTTKEGSENYAHDGNVTFKSTYSPITFTKENKSVLFMGGSNTLYYPQPNLTDPNNPVYPRIGAFRAYFQLNNGITAGDPQSGGVKRFVLNLGDADVATGLRSMDNGQWTMDNGQWTMDNGAWYTTDGRKMENKPTQRGIYIHNGRKVVIK